MRNFEEEVRRVIGKTLTEEEIRELLPLAFGELELAIGTALSEGLKDEELAEFEVFIDTSNEEGSVQWLQAHRPDYKEVVAGQLAALLTRLAAINA